MNSKQWITDDVREVLAVYPYAYCVSDQDGFYITTENDIIAKGRKPAKAWSNAAEAIKAIRRGKKKRGAQTPV